jgi:PAS domain S-box-containing protein
MGGGRSGENLASSLGDDTEAAAARLARLILDSATDCAIITTDLDGSVTSWSRGARRLLGYAADEMVGRNIDVLFTPEDRAAGVAARESAATLREGRSEDGRWYVTKDGARIWGQGALRPLRDEAGRAIGFIRVVRDRTAEHRAEETRARQLLDASPAASAPRRRCSRRGISRRSAARRQRSRTTSTTSSPR